MSNEREQLGLPYEVTRSEYSEGQIYTDRYLSANEAVKHMTDNWIEDGEHCDMTVITMRDYIASPKQAKAPEMYELLKKLSACLIKSYLDMEMFACEAVDIAKEGHSLLSAIDGEQSGNPGGLEQIDQWGKYNFDESQENQNDDA